MCGCVWIFVASINNKLVCSDGNQSQDSPHTWQGFYHQPTLSVVKYLISDKIKISFIPMHWVNCLTVVELPLRENNQQNPMSEDRRGLVDSLVITLFTKASIFQCEFSAVPPFTPLYVTLSSASGELDSQRKLSSHQIILHSFCTSLCFYRLNHSLLPTPPEKSHHIHSIL